MTEQLSGPQLFLRYAWPCAEDRLEAGKISERYFGEAPAINLIYADHIALIQIEIETTKIDPSTIILFFR